MDLRDLPIAQCNLQRNIKLNNFKNADEHNEKKNIHS